MHIIVLVVIVVLMVYLLISRLTADRTAVPEAVPFRNEAQNDWRYPLAFISNGKLFYQAPDEPLRELQSPHVLEMMDRMQRQQQLHGWKGGTSFDSSMSSFNRQAGADAVEVHATSAQFLSHDRVLYALKDTSFGGLFEYDLTRDKEKRLLHKQYLKLDGLRLHPNGKRLLCTEHASNGAANIISMDVDGSNYRELTSGDTVDASPTWVPGQVNSILFQSSGLARSEAGYVVAQGPTSIQMADAATGSLTAVLEDPRWDFMQPRVGSNGFLYFIRRPYEAPRYGFGSMIVDTLLFPFRLLRAVFHYLNFFSLMYTRKPLTTASGPAMEADLKNILIKGKRMDAEAALRSHARLSGVPSLVPASWKLMCRSPEGQEYVLASSVASFDIAADDSLLFTNGYGVFALTSGGSPKVLLKEKLILDVIAAPERSAPNIQIW